MMAASEDTRYAIAWHGTPHVWGPEPGFPHGRPRLDKIGTGEGRRRTDGGTAQKRKRCCRQFFVGMIFPKPKIEMR